MAALSRATPLLAALTVAAILHLSTVSIFSIVIRVPRAAEQYSSLEVVRHEPQKPRTAPRRGQLRLRLTPASVRESLIRPPVSLPEIELPKLPNLQAGPSAEPRLEVRNLYEGLFGERPDDTLDSWALFTQELRQFGRALTGLAAEPVPEQTAPPIRVSNVAPEFNLEIRWLSEPRERRLLFSPPVEALWQVDPNQLPDPVTLVFVVNVEGRVTEVQAPVDPAGIAGELEKALREYRFEAVDAESGKDQRGMLVLSVEAGAE